MDGVCFAQMILVHHFGGGVSRGSFIVRCCGCCFWFPRGISVNRVLAHGSFICIYFVYILFV